MNEDNNVFERIFMIFPISYHINYIAGACCSQLFAFFLIVVILSIPYWAACNFNS